MPLGATPAASISSPFHPSSQQTSSENSTPPVDVDRLGASLDASLPGSNRKRSSSPLSPSSSSNTPQERRSGQAESGTQFEDEPDEVKRSEDTDTSSGPSKPDLLHKRSVKSIVQAYELTKDPFPSSVTSHLSGPASASLHHPHQNDGHGSGKGSKENIDPTSPTGGSRNAPLPLANSGPTYLAPSVPVDNRRSSVLLSTASYPSTYNHTFSRSRTISSSSLHSLHAQNAAPSRTPSPRLSPSQASVALPTPTVSVSSMPSSSEAEMPSNLTSSSPTPTPADDTSAPTSGASSASSLKVPSSEGDLLSSVLDDDEGLYEDMDSVADLDASPTLNINLNRASSRKDISKMTAAERREHSRRHSRVHSRNLSVFFPRPETDAEREADQIRASEQFAGQTVNAAAMPSSAAAAVSLQPSAMAHTPASTSEGVGQRHTGSGNRPQITVSTDPSTLSPRSASFAQTAQAQTLAHQQGHSYPSHPSSSARISAGGLSAQSHHSDLSPSPTKARRGHHHKHSVSHAAMHDSGLSPNGHGGVHMAFSSSASSFRSDSSISTPGFLTPRREASDPFGGISIPEKRHPHDHSQHGNSPGHHHHHHHHDHDHSHSHAHRGEATSLAVRTLSTLAKIPSSSRPLLVFGLAHFALGASLWVAGQSSDSLSATGLGYLVVFDAMGVLSSFSADWASVVDDRDSSQQRAYDGKGKVNPRKPYGNHRLPTLLHFVQTIYLLFASVYVLKESVEHALLEGGGGAHGHGGGGPEGLDGAFGHERSHVHEEHGFGLVLPNLLLALSLAACVFSNIFLSNHSRLVAACGISTAASGSSSGTHAVSTRGHGRSGSVLAHPSALASPLLVLLANPFSLTVLFFSTALLFAGLSMPPLQVAALDKVLAGLESVSMFYVAYPASVALGKVLLQTAPSEQVAQKVQMTRALKTVEEHPMVSYVGPVNLWQLTPPTSSMRQSASGAGTGGGGVLGNVGRGVQQGAKSASLIATVTVFLKPNTTEHDCFEMTRWVWERVAPSVGAGRGLAAGEMLRGTLRAGELTVCVKREGWEDDGVQLDGHYYAHGHDHGHDHGHGHGHDHGHGHCHDHGHDLKHPGHDHGSHSHLQHGHGNGHVHAHAHDHSNGHGHNHGHGHGHGHGHSHGHLDGHEHGHGDQGSHHHAHKH